MIDLNSRDDKIRLLETQIEQNSVKRKNLYDSLSKQKVYEDGKLSHEINDLKEAFEQEIQAMDTKYQKVRKFITFTYKYGEQKGSDVACGGV